MTDEQKKLWNDACQHLKQTLSKDVFEKWIAVIQCRKIDHDQVILVVGNDFYQSWLEEHYLPLIKNALALVSGQTYDIQLVVDYSLASEQEEQPDTAENVKEKVRSILPQKRGTKETKTNLNSNYTFDSFVVGPSNQFAHAAAMASAQSPSRAYNPLFIYGGVGLGKTHLMQAIGNFILSKKGKGKVCYTTSEAFLNEYIEALQTNSLAKFRKKYRTVDALLIDDIHFLAGKERLQEEFFHTFNAIFENHKQIVMTSDRPAGELEGLAPRLVSRFEWGLVVEMESPDVETRVAILRKKSEQLKLSIEQNLLFYIAERISSNIRRLEGALIRVASYISLTGQSMDMGKLEYLLRDTLDQEKKHAISVENIQKTVAEHFDLRVGDLLGRKRTQNIAWPRQVAMYLSRDMTNLSFPSIGDSFGRNHATVVHACKTVEKEQTTDLKLRQTLSLLRQRAGHQSAQTVS
ncbi:chromosomal replication initiator protein DnaA [Tichowtungia aerotolerans]|uniref:Chromosomal replication initiator protein DnaA n=1 Tax=Tichowtungia aerotolerans TaxID=2697043 RepID=A0A6P1M573_9BACT|nr:chromosomal replication initiator protein DnaA [Tichowtungia aerotolerans]QHI68997.1 chromosomal replication initiator protein DnaA [Tichowtungia aerotolerans]